MYFLHSYYVNIRSAISSALVTFSTFIFACCTFFMLQSVDKANQMKISSILAIASLLLLLFVFRIMVVYSTLNIPQTPTLPTFRSLRWPGISSATQCSDDLSSILGVCIFITHYDDFSTNVPLSNIPSNQILCSSSHFFAMRLLSSTCFREKSGSITPPFILCTSSCTRCLFFAPLYS